jgi:hypothetical protein
MRKLFVILTAVVALTAASKAMVVWAQDTAAEAPEAMMAEVVNNEVMSNEVMNEVSNEAMNVVNEAVVNEAGAAMDAGTGNTY